MELEILLAAFDKTDNPEIRKAYKEILEMLINGLDACDFDPGSAIEAKLMDLEELLDESDDSADDDDNDDDDDDDDFDPDSLEDDDDDED